MKHLWETEPLSVNEQGVKYWLEETATNYARNKGLSDVVVFLTEMKDGDRTYLITENQVPLYESKSLEGIGVQLDVMRLVRESEEQEND